MATPLGPPLGPLGVSGVLLSLPLQSLAVCLPHIVQNDCPPLPARAFRPHAFANGDAAANIEEPRILFGEPSDFGGSEQLGALNLWHRLLASLDTKRASREVFFFSKKTFFSKSSVCF
jgi:hypothetical protein